MKRMTIFVTGVVLLLLTTTVLAQAIPAIDWSVIAGGGGYIEGGSISLDGTIG